MGDGVGCMPCMPGRARPDVKSGSEDPETSEAAVAAVATLVIRILAQSITKEMEGHT